MNSFKIILICLGFAFLGCSDKNEVEVDTLETTGILGNWEINYRSYNGIEPLIIVCCEFMEFTEDENTQDMSGIYKYSSEQFFRTGEFTLDDSNQIILSQNDNIFEFTLSESKQEFILLYSDQDNTLVHENWVRME